MDMIDTRDVFLRPANIVQGIIGLKFENPDELDYNAQYCMVESPAFFEAYRHVLEALQVSNEHEREHPILPEGTVN